MEPDGVSLGNRNQPCRLPQDSGLGIVSFKPGAANEKPSRDPNGGSAELKKRAYSLSWAFSAPHSTEISHGRRSSHLMSPTC